jgi:hypothetical protein
MKTPFPKSIAAIFCAATLFSAALSLQAQAQTNKPASDKKSSSSSSTEKKQSAGPFHGKLGAVDKAAKTVTVGNDKPATLNDGVLDDVVSGYFKTGSDGKLKLTTLRFGPKTETSAKSTKKKSATQ